MKVLNKFTRFLFCSDLHGDEQNKSAVEAVLSFKKEFNPEVTIFGGDLFDMRCLLKNAGANDKNHDPREDFKLGTEFIERLEPDVFIWGNHDKRILKLSELSGDGARRAIGIRFKEDMGKLLNKMLIKEIPYKSRGIYKLGCIKFMHGIYPGKNACTQHVNTFHSTVVFGHTHAISSQMPENDEGHVGYNTGCLCNTEMEWNEDTPQVLRQENGFAYGVVNNKSHYLIQARKVNGLWICPTI